MDISSNDRWNLVACHIVCRYCRFMVVGKVTGVKVGETIHNKSSKSVRKPINDDLQKTSVLIKQYFPDYRVTRKTNHLLLSKQDKKIAMITMDKKIASGQRLLGNVPVINYHRVPNRAQLAANLQQAE